MPAHYTCIHTHLQTCEGFLTAGPRGEKEGTAKKVASKVFGGGISPAKLSLILNGKQEPDLFFLKQCKKVLNIPAEFILEFA